MKGTQHFVQKADLSKLGLCKLSEVDLWSHISISLCFRCEGYFMLSNNVPLFFSTRGTYKVGPGKEGQRSSNPIRTTADKQQRDC